MHWRSRGLSPAGQAHYRDHFNPGGKCQNGVKIGLQTLSVWSINRDTRYAMHFSYWRGNHWDKILSVVYLFAPKCVTCGRVFVRLLKWTFVLVTVSLWGLKPDWCWWLFVECLAGSDNKLISESLDIISPHNLWRLYHSPLCPMSPLTTATKAGMPSDSIFGFVSSSEIFWGGSISHPGSEGGSDDECLWWPVSTN